MRLQWSVRTLMIAVGVSGLVLGAIAGVAVERRRAYYRLRVESLAWGEADIVERIAERLKAARDADNRGPEGQQAAAAARAEAEWLSQLAAWHVKVERTYMQAIDRPWESLPPDPPPPPPPWRDTPVAER